MIVRKITFWLSLVLIFVIPWEDSITIGAIGSLARLMGFVVAGFWLATIILEGRFRKPHIFHAFVFLFFLWNIVSMLWTLDASRTIQRAKTYSQIFLLLLIFWELYKKPTDLIAGLQAYIFGGFVSITSSMVNYLKGTTAVNYEVRYSATGVNAVDLALILLLGLPLAWHLFSLNTGKQAKILKWINFAYIPLSVFSILLTASRTALLGIIPFVVYILWTKRNKLEQMFLFMLILVLSVFVLQLYLPPPVIKRLSTVLTSVETADVGGRVSLWLEARGVFSQHPLIGSGSGTLSTTIGADSHNTLISIVAETGLVGFLLFSSILAITFYQAAKLPKGYAGTWLTILFTWVIGTSSLSWEFRKPTWLFLSLVIIQASMFHEKASMKKDKPEVPQTSSNKS